MVYLCDASSPLSPLVEVLPRKKGVEYHVQHWNGHLLFVTNADGADNFKVCSLPLSSLSSSSSSSSEALTLSWKLEFPDDPLFQIKDIDVFKRHAVLYYDSKGRFFFFRFSLFFLFLILSLCFSRCVSPSFFPFISLIDSLFLSLSFHLVRILSLDDKAHKLVVDSHDASHPKIGVIAPSSNLVRLCVSPLSFFAPPLYRLPPSPPSLTSSFSNIICFNSFSQQDFDSDTVRFTHSSPISPESIYEHDMTARRTHVVETEEIQNEFTDSSVQQLQVPLITHEGEPYTITTSQTRISGIPVTVHHRNDIEFDGR